MQRVFALQNDGSKDGGKVHVPRNDGLLQREAVERAPDGNAGQGAERQGGEVRQGETGVFFLGYPAGAEKRIANVSRQYKIVRKHPSGCFFVWVIMKNTVNVVFSENLILYLAKDARQSRLTTIIVLVATTLAGVGYYLYYAELGRLQVHDTNEDFLYLFCLFQSLLFIYLLLVTGISHFIKVK